MKVFIDFDDVLFNTRQFSVDLERIFVSSGISRKIFRKDYDDYPVKGINGIRKYNVWQHIRLVKKRGFDTNCLEKRVDKMMYGVKQYIFRDAVRFLREFSKNELYILSYGDKYFQQYKINHSGIRKYFGKTIVLEGTKVEGIRGFLGRKINRKERIFFIDDRIIHINDVKKNMPSVVTILFRRKEGRYKDQKNHYSDKVAKNLDEVETIINKASK